MASGDFNVNITFGGIAHQGCNIVFHKIHETKTMSFGCTAHIVHNSVQTVTGFLPRYVGEIA